MAIDREDFGKHLKGLRLRKGWSVKELAEKATLSASAIRFFENGNFFPRLETLVLLADALDITLNELVFGENA